MNFFDKHPVVQPWPEVLRQSQFKVAYKPREVWWQKHFSLLKLAKGERVLEVGCGEGIWLDRLAGRYEIEGFGIDASLRAVRSAQQNSKVKTNHFQLADACQLPFPKASFDLVFSLDTLEHIHDQKKVIAEMARVLKPGGGILIYTINAKQKWTWNWWLSKMGVDVYKHVDHDQKLFLDGEWLEEQLREKGVKIVRRDYFDAFFTLAADELVMVFLSGWQRFLGWENGLGFARLFLKGLTWFSWLGEPVGRFFDYPWLRAGRANGILVSGVKEG